MGIEALGISLNQCPSLRGQYKGGLLILGGGRCVWDDLSKVHDTRHVMCINDVGMHYPGFIHHWYSNDHHWLHKWAAARRPQYQRDYKCGTKFHTCAVGDSNMHVWPWPGHGSSALNAVYTALALGYEDIILGGVPLDDSGHYFDPPWIKTNFVREVPEVDRHGKVFPRYWVTARNQVFEGKVKSLSGRTKDLLGSP